MSLEAVREAFKVNSIFFRARGKGLISVVVTDDEKETTGNSLSRQGRKIESGILLR